MRKLLLLGVALGFYAPSWAQYDPAGGESGSQAIHRDHSAISAWADSIIVQRGYQDISNKGLGYANTGQSIDALGPADGVIVSLGDGGMATYIFAEPLKNIMGPDFVVFENGFQWTSGYFLELAFVEVSSDGQKFTRFPSISAADTNDQIWNLSNMKPEWYHNLAGKHQAPYGTPFDLDELKDSVLSIDSIRFIRIVDVVGSLNDSFARFDSRGVKINDPWPTSFESSGFDLDGLALLDHNVSNQLVNLSAEAYGPNPIRRSQPLNVNFEFKSVSIFDSFGKCIAQYQACQTLKLDLLPSTYMLTFDTDYGPKYGKLCVY